MKHWVFRRSVIQNITIWILFLPGHELIMIFDTVEFFHDPPKCIMIVNQKGPPCMPYGCAGDPIVAVVSTERGRIKPVEHWLSNTLKNGVEADPSGPIAVRSDDYI
jgi:hypothetical protein